MLSTAAPAHKRKNFYIAGTMAALAANAAATIAAALWGAPWLVWVAVPTGAACLFFAFAWARALDEVALRAHVDAWFWGGLLGTSITAMAFVLSVAWLASAGVLETFLNAWVGRADAITGFAVGFMAAILPMAIGYTLWWTVFWLRRR